MSNQEKAGAEIGTLFARAGRRVADARSYRFVTGNNLIPTMTGLGH